jgi:hypothetical protein
VDSKVVSKERYPRSVPQYFCLNLKDPALAACPLNWKIADFFKIVNLGAYTVSIEGIVSWINFFEGFKSQTSTFCLSIDK